MPDEASMLATIAALDNECVELRKSLDEATRLAQQMLPVIREALAWQAQLSLSNRYSSANVKLVEAIEKWIQEK
jgi:hypothetical protein